MSLNLGLCQKISRFKNGVVLLGEENGSETKQPVGPPQKGSQRITIFISFLEYTMRARKRNRQKQKSSIDIIDKENKEDEIEEEMNEQMCREQI